MTNNDTTPNDDLRELVEEWRDAQERRQDNPDAHPIRAQVLGRCAEELENVIEE